MRLSLDDTENLLSKIGNHHRLLNWKEKATTWLQYPGYFSLGLVLLYILYKCGIIEAIPKCLPKKICLFCVKTNVANSTMPTIVTYGSNPTEDIPLRK